MITHWKLCLPPTHLQSHVPKYTLSSTLYVPLIVISLKAETTWCNLCKMDQWATCLSLQKELSKRPADQHSPLPHSTPPPLPWPLPSLGCMGERWEGPCCLLRTHLLDTTLDKGEKWEGTISTGKGKKDQGSKKKNKIRQTSRTWNKWPGDFPKYFNVVDKIICWLLYLHFGNAINLYVYIHIF